MRGADRFSGEASDVPSPGYEPGIRGSQVHIGAVGSNDARCLRRIRIAALPDDTGFPLGGGVSPSRAALPPASYTRPRGITVRTP